MSKNTWEPKLPPFVKHKKKVFKNAFLTANIIYQIGESTLLREKSQNVPIELINSKNFKQKIKYIKECLKKYRKLTGAGRGISAIQIGILERFSVVYMPEIKGKYLILINPKIIKTSKKYLKYPEICMSAFPVIAPVTRPSWIEFEYYDEKGVRRYWNRKNDTKTNKIYNRVFQHELDHMDGIINIDRVESRELTLESDPKFYEKAKFEETTP